MPLKTADEATTTDLQPLMSLMRTMLRVRRFDERTIELFLAGEVKGTAHSCVGQEAIAAGACSALTPADFIVSHHRGHGHCLAKGAQMDRMMAELMGRITGYCRGLGGSMHIADLSLNILGANGVVGAGIGIGTGAALAAKIRADGSCGVVFFGDGAANEGIFHEALNIAGIWQLPVVYLCENNQYGLSTPMVESTAVARLSERAAGYRMPGLTIDGNDVLAVRQAVAEAAARARRGDGPTLIEAITYRWGDHSMRANLPAYRADAELADWRSRDPIVRFEAVLLDSGAAPVDLQTLRDDAEAELTAAIAFARESAEPTWGDIEGAITAPHAAPPEPPQSAGRELSMPEAINEAIEQAMAEDERVFVIGEDIAKIGGIFGCTRGLLDRYGTARVRDAPISEQGIAGCAVGAAIKGLRPVVEIQIFDFCTLMMDMIVNQAAKFRFMLGGTPTVPIVFRGPQGGGIRLAAQHSQSLEAWFTHVPGLVVLAPSNAHDAKGLLLSAIRDDNPVVFLESKLLYGGRKQPVNVEPYAIPIGRAVIRRHGEHLTIVATLVMVDRALQAARELEREGIDCEVIDPRTLRPLDEATILKSVRRTSRLLIAHEGWKTGGFGSQVAALVAEQAIDWLDAPIARVGGRDTPMPYNPKLEAQSVPTVADIVRTARALIRRDTLDAPAFAGDAP